MNTINKQNIIKNKLNNNLDILIVGMGGCGNTSFIKYLKQKNIKVNHIGNKDNFKHMLKPHEYDYKCQKVVFIYGDLPRAIYNHYRRWKNVNMHFKNLHTQLPLNYSQYVNKVCTQNKDVSRLFEQFQNWSNGSSKQPVFMLNFNEFPLVKKQIENFLGITIDLDFNTNRLKKYDRNRQKFENEQYRQFYDKIYNKMKKINGIIIEPK